MNPIVRRLALCGAGLLLLCTGSLTACGQKRAEAPELRNIDPATAERLGLTADAIDPTERDVQAGYNRWKPKPEPEGTADPLSPTRRKIGAPPP